MRFSSRDNVECSAQDVFRHLVDVDYFERLAIQRGAKIERLSGEEALEVGSVWNVWFTYRARKRKMRFEIEEIQPNTRIQAKLDFQSRMKGTFLIELIPISEEKTRMIVGLEVEALTLSARLLLQSFKLSRRLFDARYAQWVDGFARNIEERNRNVDAVNSGEALTKVAGFG